MPKQLSNLDIHRRIEQRLRAANIDFEAEVPLGGLRVDFLAKSPDGRIFVIEAKNATHKVSEYLLAESDAKRFKDATGANDAFVVVDKRPSLLSKGIVSEEDLVETLLLNFQKTTRSKIQPIAVKKNKEPKRIIFAAMPFSGEYEDVYFIAMAHAANAVNAICERVDQDDYQGDIVDRIKTWIRKSDVVIADLSDSKPNVLYEVGYAHALGRPTIHICSSPLEELPFDVRNWNTLEYTKGQIHKLRGKLAQRLKAIFSE